MMFSSNYINFHNFYFPFSFFLRKFAQVSGRKTKSEVFHLDIKTHFSSEIQHSSFEKSINLVSDYTFDKLFLTLFFQASVLDLLFVEWSELPNQFLTFGVIRLMKRVEWILPALWVASKFPKELHLWVENTFLKDNRCLFLDFNHFHEVLNST